MTAHPPLYVWTQDDGRTFVAYEYRGPDGTSVLPTYPIAQLGGDMTGFSSVGTLTGVPDHDGMVLDVPRETGDSLYFPVKPESPVDGWVEAMLPVMGQRPRPTVRDEYRISHPPRLNRSGTAVVYEYVGRV